MALEKVGDVSNPIVGQYGVHILQYLRDVPGGAVELTDEMLKSPEIAADFTTGEAKIELKDGKLTLPPHSSVILRAKEG